MNRQIMLRQMKRRYEDYKKYRTAFDTSHTSWYRMETEDPEPVVYIYDGIGMFGVSAEEFVQDFDGINAEKITLRLNSPGGDVFDGIAIYNSVKGHPAEVKVKVDGLAASAASLIAMAGDTIHMSEASMMMLHEPWGFTIGNASEHRDTAALLDKIGEQALDIYSARSGIDKEDLRAIAAAETWFTGPEALEAGLATSVDEGGSSAQNASLMFDLSVFSNTPEEIQFEPSDDVTRRGIEQALKSVGLSRKEIRTLMKAGYTSSQSQNADEDEISATDFTLDKLRRLSQ